MAIRSRGSGSTGSYAADGWPGVEEAARYSHSQVAAGALGFPDLYVVLSASIEQLQQRKSADPTRCRRNFDAHLRLVTPQRRP